MKKLKRVVAITMGTALISTSFIGCSNQTAQTETKAKEQQEEFTPKLETEKSVNLDIAGFFGNFEALDQVINNFNEYYPNVTMSYNQNNGDLVEYFQNNSYVDIFMTNYDNVCSPNLKEKYIYDNCVDLSKEDIDLSAIDSKMIESCKENGSLVRIPMGQSLHGIVVNKTLLEKEGLEIPTNYKEFSEVCEALKKKGYTPIQGSTSQVYSNLIINMAMVEIGNNEEAKQKINSGDGNAAVEVVKPVFERLTELIDKGYTDYDVNNSYPYDNYDEAILRFFEGEVPFWVCDTEKVSGMKKRESKSETFTKNPFEYEFMYAPMGDKGCYEYVEPWYGFSVNKDSDEKDYAIEFIRFLATEKQINIMAEVKGVPSVAVNSTDERYTDVKNPSNVEASYVNDGGTTSLLRNSIEVIATAYGEKKVTLDKAMKDLEDYCVK